MALNLAHLCLLPPQDLLSSYQLSHPVAIQLHQALTQFQQALSGEESLQANTINAALHQLTPVEVIPLTKEFSTGTNLKCQQVQEFDRYMEVEHVKSEAPASLIVASLLRAYLGFLEISAFRTFNPNKSLVKSGFTTYAILLRRALGLSEYNWDDNINDSQNYNSEPNLELSPLQIWKKGHWVFLVFSQALNLSLNRLVDAIGNNQLDQAKVEFETAAELQYASGAAMKLTGNFTREKYESEIRPTMITGNPQSLVQSENLSGLMMWDHNYLINVICQEKLLPIMKNLPTQLEAEHEKFVLAYKCGLSDGHKSICAEFGGGEIGSLIAASESSGALKNLKKFEKVRSKILDPQGRVTGECPVTQTLRAKASMEMIQSWKKRKKTQHHPHPES
ncbi:hypothetical protein [Microseira wollei]|uniref:Uncharacterized protein n=1 Tax=Microseira wollei NIES-4236 TaxID=2530354 RepID=A0AAV3XMD4_9CYAN|nr:hypothetical protein [Microseira wollei]GET40692.1 hypothetical protein MiSe_55030 [Microseira wollei NIES-4236]